MKVIMEDPYKYYAKNIQKGQKGEEYYRKTAEFYAALA